MGRLDGAFGTLWNGFPGAVQCSIRRVRFGRKVTLGAAGWLRRNVRRWQIAPVGACGAFRDWGRALRNMD